MAAAVGRSNIGERPRRVSAVGICEANLAVNPDVAEDYAAWLAGRIGDMLAVAGVVSAEWWTVAEDDPDDARRPWCAPYRVESREALEAYVSDHAARLRGDALVRFGGRFAATRRVLLPRPA